MTGQPVDVGGGGDPVQRVVPVHEHGWAAHGESVGERADGSVAGIKRARRRNRQAGLGRTIGLRGGRTTRRATSR